MIVAVIDGMGGGLGAQLIANLRAKLEDKAEIVAFGTNAMATNSMLKAGASRGATGENAICVGLRKAVAVVGPIGIIIPHALLGEITPAIAAAVALADAKKILIPVTQNHVDIVGLEPGPMSHLIREASDKVLACVQHGSE